MSKARDLASAAPAPSTVSATELGYLDGVTSAIQTQLDAKTAKSTLTTTGDIYYASAANTPARLGIGTAAQILAVNSGATAPEWVAAPSSGGMTLLSTTTLSGTSTTVSSINQGYTNLHIMIVNATAGATYRPRFLPNATGDLVCVVYATTEVGNSTQIGAINATLWNTTGANAITLSINNYASTSQYKTITAYGSSNNDSACSFLSQGFINTTSAITSFTHTTIAGTASFTGGTMLIYGVK